MKRSLLIFIFTFFLNKINSNTTGDCYLKGVKNTQWITAYQNDPVNDFEEKEFKRFLIKNVSEVQVYGYDYGKYFLAKLLDNNLIISPSPLFKFFEINEKSTTNPEMNIRLNFKCKTGMRQLAFYQPIRDSNTYDPEFLQPAFTYTLPMPLPGKFDLSVFGEPIIACDLDISNVQLDFFVNPVKDFSLLWDGPINDTNKCHKAILKTNNPLRLTSKTVYQIIVRDRGMPSLTNIAKLEVNINESNSIPPNPQFESPYYTANYSYENDEYKIVMDNPIRLKNECSKVKLDLLEYKDNFRIYCAVNEITVELITSPVDGQWENMVVVLVTIVATLEHAERPGKTVLVMRLPQEKCEKNNNAMVSTTACSYGPSTIDCPICSKQQSSYYTCPPCNTDCPLAATECPPCPSNSPIESVAVTSTTGCPCITKPEPQESAIFIMFKQNKYMFEVEFSHDDGFVGVVAAEAFPEELIQYSIGNGEALINIDKNTGRLKILTKLDPGTYKFIVYAEGEHSKIKAHTKVTITVLKNPDKSKTMTSVLIEHVLENEKRFIPLPCNCDYCSYEIIKQYPETNPKLFGIYSKTQLHAIPIDREMDEIINMKIPQFMLWLVITSTGNCIWQNSLKNNSLSGNREWAFIPAQISHTPDQMLASIIIDDDNDNPPVFEAGVKLIIGYPVKSLANVIAPSYLTKVTATDLDAGENAEILYRTDSKDFIIHPKTGVIYVGDDAVNDDSNNLQFNVVATDRNGLDDGLSANLIVEVKPLKENHVIVLRVKSILLEELNILLENLSNKINMEIKYLSSAVIPIAHSENFSGSLPGIIVYGLNSENEPVEAYTLENAIEDCTENILVDKVDLENLSNGENEENNFNKTILITALVILSLLLVFFTNAVVALYYFKVYLVKKSCAQVFNKTHTT